MLGGVLGQIGGVFCRGLGDRFGAFCWVSRCVDWGWLCIKLYNILVTFWVFGCLGLCLVCGCEMIFMCLLGGIL
jgi:hypothetical protein